MDSASARLELSHLYLQHRRKALAIARRILGDQDEAEDVVQDVFTRLCRREDCFDGRAAYSTWLHRVMVNSSINNLRARRRRGRLGFEPAEGQNPEEATLEAELHEHLVTALEEVSEQHRQVLMLRDLRGLAYPEIAQLLGIPEGTVKSALNRGRARLMEVLEKRGL